MNGSDGDRFAYVSCPVCGMRDRSFTAPDRRRYDSVVAWIWHVQATARREHLLNSLLCEGDVLAINVVSLSMDEIEELQREGFHTEKSQGSWTCQTPTAPTTGFPPPTRPS